MSPWGNRLYTFAQVIAGVLGAELVLCLGVLLADASAGGQPAQQIHCYGSDAASSVLAGAMTSGRNKCVWPQPFYCSRTAGR